MTASCVISSKNYNYKIIRKSIPNVLCRPTVIISSYKNTIAVPLKLILLLCLQFVKARFELKSKFYLLGYSFGVNVALELAALLEKEG